ncbi:uncharacterized protein LOC121380709 [Gigantopelta aegis]|uniref:uncharacterized protein LOC121380709 n=1 Tax=Gigantopelta aegis TaxID=1735272 RepID=UPI001B88A533|nr:uncharacterized protein LOC121380709 [Gigantopelta aegis]
MIQLFNIQPDEENWIIVGDFNSHSPSWGYKSLDSKGEEIEEWMISNNLILINTPDDPNTFYSRAWRTTSNPDLAIATDDIHKITAREVCHQLGGSDHKPVILNIKKQTSFGGSKLQPSWNYKQANWDLLKKNLQTLIQSKQYQEEEDNYRPFWNSTLDKLHNDLSEAARENIKKTSSIQNIVKHNNLKTAFGNEKLEQTGQAGTKKLHP